MSTPWHPAIVHFPIGFAFAVPLLAFGVFWAIRREWLPDRAWLIVLSLQLLTVVAGIAAKQTGEWEEHMVEPIVGEDNIETHETRAKIFIVISGISFGVGLCEFLPPVRAFAMGTRLASSVLSMVAAGMAGATGHSGGELVYKYGATKAYVTEPK